jgi:outer membrane receptor for ferrienterochelin and colicins
MKRCPAALTMILLVGAGPALADDAGDLRGLLEQTVVTTASKSAETGTDAPATSSTITAEQLRRHGIHSLDEAIDFLSLGAVTSNPLREVDIGARGIVMAGDQGAHFLLLVDGHAVNEPLYGSARFERGAGIPMELVDHIEVILGPGSVLYGSNAMFGVINVVTKRAAHNRGGHLVAETEIGKSHRGGANVGIPFKLGGTNAEATVALEYYRQDGPAFTLGPQGPSSSDVALRQYSRYARSGPGTGVWGGSPASHSHNATVPTAHGRLLIGDFELSLHASTYRRASPDPTFKLGPTPFYDDPGNYATDRAAWVDAKYHATLSPIAQVTARAYADTRDVTRQYEATLWAPCGPNGMCKYDWIDTEYRWLGASRWGGAEMQATFDWLGSNLLSTIAGVDARLVLVESKLDATSPDGSVVLAPTARRINEIDRTVGLYLQQAWRPTRALGVNVGARIDAARGYDPVISPRMAITVQPWAGGTLKGILAQAFRAPSWDERAAEDRLRLLARDLKPERVTSVEASFEQRFGAHRILFGGFASRWSDLIEDHPLTAAEVAALQSNGLIGAFASSYSQYRNVSRIDDIGANMALDGTLATSQLHYGVTATSAYARRQLGGVEQIVPVAPRWFGNARISYDFLAPWPVVGIVGRVMARRPADRAIDGQFPTPPWAPALFELRATISGPAPLLEGLSYRVSVDHTFAAQAPYVVGIFRGYHLDGDALLMPIDQTRATVGLQYDIP